MSPDVTLDKKQIILQAAMGVFARAGFAEAKVADIAKLAGVGKGTVYEYFKSKQDILEQASILYLDEMVAMVGPFAGYTDPCAALTELVQQTIAFAGQLKEVLPVVIDFWAAGLKEPESLVGQQMAKGLKSMMDTVAQIVTKGQQQKIFRKEVNGRYVGLLLFTMLDEGVLASIWLENEIDMDEYGRNIIRMLEDHLLTVRKS